MRIRSSNRKWSVRFRMTPLDENLFDQNHPLTEILYRIASRPPRPPSGKFPIFIDSNAGINASWTEAEQQREACVTRRSCRWKGGYPRDLFLLTRSIITSNEEVADIGDCL